MGTWKHRLSEIDADALTADCEVCGRVKVRRKKGGYRCFEAEKQWKNVRPKSQAERFDRKFQEQGGRCAICGETKPLRLDHDHATGEERDLLCHHCNVGLGFFLDDVELMKRAIKYLLRHSGRAKQ